MKIFFNFIVETNDCNQLSNEGLRNYIEQKIKNTLVLSEEKESKGIENVTVVPYRTIWFNNKIIPKKGESIIVLGRDYWSREFVSFDKNKDYINPNSIWTLMPNEDKFKKILKEGY